MSNSQSLKTKSDKFASDYKEVNEMNHTTNDFDIRPPRNECYLYSGSRTFNNRLIIDSAKRPNPSLTTPAKYTVPLEREYVDVLSIELINAIIPFSGYNITSNNNTIYFQESFSEIFKTTIPPGNYTAVQLASVMQNAMNFIGESNYTISVLENLKKFKFVSDWSGGDGVFKLLFEESANKNKHNTDTCTYLCNSIGPVIGFPCNSKECLYTIGTSTSQANSNEVCGIGTFYTNFIMIGDLIMFEDDSTPYQVTDIISDTLLLISPNKIDTSKNSKISVNSFISPNSYNLTPVKYISLFINDDTSNSLNKIESNNNNLRGAFCIIPRFLPDADDNVFLVRGTLPEINNIYVFNPPLGKLIKMDIKFTDSAGNLYDFNGKNHILEFNIKTLNDIGN
jgi:hypothetical protein